MVSLWGQIDHLIDDPDSPTASNSIDATLKLRVQVPVSESNKKALLVLLADQSGSMRSSWQQVQAALLYIAHEALSDSNVTVKIVLYNDKARIMNLTEENYREAIFNEEARGPTCFAEAFDTAKSVIEEHLSSTKPTDPLIDIFVQFMTDGSHTTKRNAFQSYTDLKTYLGSIAHPSTVHCLGFTKQHHFGNLDRIRKQLGTNEGTFQYAEPEDGPFALQQKLEAVFNMITTAGDVCEVSLRVPGFSIWQPSDGALLSPIVVDRIRLNRDGQGTVTYSLCVVKDDTGGGRDGESIVAHAQITSNNSTTFHSVNLDTMTGIDKQALQLLSKFRRLEFALDGLVKRINQHQSAAPDESVRKEYSASLTSMHDEIKSIDEPRIFKLQRQVRGQILELRQRLNVRVSQLLETLAMWARGQWNSSASRARIADITFSALFTKSNRKRRMDARVAINAERLKEDEANLSALKLPSDLADEASTDSLALFNCVLSLSDWVEVTLEKDAIGFGLAVGRPQWIVDDPTQLRIFDISSTFFSKSAIEDAIAASIDLQGKVRTLGGFGLDQEMGVAVKGRGREPINSWCPLFINSAHWSVVSIQIRQILGYFVTLDPLGFNIDQVDTLFLVLGTMIGRLDPRLVGERQMILLFQYQRTCLELARHFNWLPSIKKQLRSIIEKSNFDLSEQPKNLLVLVGFISILSSSDFREVFPTFQQWTTFWMAILGISIRRSAFIIFAQMNESQVHKVVESILYGDALALKSSSSSSSSSSTASSTSSSSSSSSDEVIIPAEVLGVSNIKTDNYVLNQEDVSTFDPSYQSDGMQQMTSRFSFLMNRKGYPTCRSVFSSLVYCTHWSNMNFEPHQPHENLLEGLDSRFGIASDDWINRTKEVFAKSLTSDDAEEVSIETVLRFLFDQERKIEFPFDHADAPSNRSLSIIQRAMTTQGILYRTNATARAILSRGVYTMTAEDPVRCLQEVHDQMVRRRDQIRISLQQAVWFDTNLRESILSVDVDKFTEQISKLLSRPSRRDPRFPKLITMFRGSRIVDRIPNALQKLRVIFSGCKVHRDDDGNLIFSPVLDQGKLWIPGRDYTAMLSFALGGFQEFEYLMGAVMRDAESSPHQGKSTQEY